MAHQAPTNLSLREMTPYCQTLVLIDNFLLSLEIRGYREDEHVRRFEKMKYLLRMIIILGRAPYSIIGEALTHDFIGEWREYFREQAHRYLGNRAVIPD